VSPPPVPRRRSRGSGDGRAGRARTSTRSAPSAAAAPIRVPSTTETTHLMRTPPGSREQPAHGDPPPRDPLHRRLQGVERGRTGGPSLGVQQIAPAGTEIPSLDISVRFFRARRSHGVDPGPSKGGTWSIRQSSTAFRICVLPEQSRSRGKSGPVRRTAPMLQRIARNATALRSAWQAVPGDHRLDIALHDDLERHRIPSVPAGAGRIRRRAERAVRARG